MVVTIDDLKITTCTFSGEISKMIPLTELYDNLVINDDIVYVAFDGNETGTRKRRQPPKMGPHRRTFMFYNLVSIQFADNAAIKIFKNGRFIITGTKSAQQAKRKLQDFVDLINSWRPQRYISVIDVILVDEMIRGYYEDVYYSRILKLEPQLVNYFSIIRGIENDEVEKRLQPYKKDSVGLSLTIKYQSYTILVYKLNKMIIASKTFEVKKVVDFLLRVLNDILHFEF